MFDKFYQTFFVLFVWTPFYIKACNLNFVCGTGAIQENALKVSDKPLYNKLTNLSPKMSLNKNNISVIIVKSSQFNE
jgi:hypothetical protein